MGRIEAPAVQEHEKIRAREDIMSSAVSEFLLGWPRIEAPAVGRAQVRLRRPRASARTTHRPSGGPTGPHRRRARAA